MLSTVSSIIKRNVCVATDSILEVSAPIP